MSVGVFTADKAAYVAYGGYQQTAQATGVTTAPLPTLRLRKKVIGQDVVEGPRTSFRKRGQGEVRFVRSNPAGFGIIARQHPWQPRAETGEVSNSRSICSRAWRMLSAHE